MKRETKETRNVYDYTMYETVIANVSRLSLSVIPSRYEKQQQLLMVPIKN